MEDVVAYIRRAKEAAYRFQQAGQIGSALALYRELAAALREDAEIQLAYGVCLLQAGERDDAEASLSRAVQLAPDEPRAHFALGRALKAQGRLDDAIGHYRRALALGPRTPDTLMSLGIALRHAGQIDEAIEALREVAEVPLHRAAALTNLGAALAQHSQPEEAARVLREAVALRPDLPEAHNNLGKALFASQATEEAESCFRRALSIRPGFPEALFNLGNVLVSRDEMEAAADCFSAAYNLDPSQADACLALARILFDVGALNPALNHLDLLMAKHAERVDVHLWRGMVLREGGRYDEAIEAFDKVIEADPTFEPGLGLKASTLWLLGNHADASYWADRALTLAPSNSLVLNLKGNLCIQAADVDGALTWYRRSIDADVENHDARSNLLFAMNYSEKFTWRHVLETHCEWGRQRQGPKESAHATPRPGRRRLGFVSPDFNQHSVAHFMEPLLAHIDRGQWDVYCFSNSRRIDAMTATLAAYPAVWRSIARLDDHAAAQQVRTDKIDILVDLAGHTSGARLGLFALAPAPVQATYLGYPTITGLPAVNFRISDPVVDPLGEESFGAEATVRLPNSYFCYRPSPEAPEIGLLPSGPTTFASFNNFTKMTGATVALWSRVLKAAPESRLLLKNKAFTDTALRASAIARFAALDVDPMRLDFRPWDKNSRDHLRQYEGVFIALDTIPYNGATTTCEALWMGVPVVTLLGPTHAGRMGASILTAAGLSNLIAHSEVEFEAICVRLAADTDWLASFRQQARKRLQASPLMDEIAFARDFEQCLRDMDEVRRGTTEAA